MSAKRFQVTYREKGTRGPLLQQTFDAEARLEVRELTSQDVVRVRPADISLYRHALVLGAKSYDVMGIFELSGACEAPLARSLSLV